MVALHVEEVIQIHKCVTPNAVLKTVNGMPGHCGRHVPRRAEVGPKNACVPYSTMILVVEHHALGLGQNLRVVTPKVVQVICVIQKLFYSITQLHGVQCLLLFYNLASIFSTEVLRSPANIK